MTVPSSPWLTVAQAQAYLQIKSPKLLYAAVAASRLRAARLGSRSLRFKAEWLDAFLVDTTEPREVGR